MRSAMKCQEFPTIAPLYFTFRIPPIARTRQFPIGIAQSLKYRTRYAGTFSQCAFR